MLNLFNDKKKETTEEQKPLGVEQRITIRGDKLGDTRTVVISPNGTEIKIIKGGF